MTTYEKFSGNQLIQCVELNVKSLMTLISEIKHSSLNCEFDPSICDVINEYIQIVQTDCQTIMNNIKSNLFSDKMCHTTQSIYGSTL